MREAMIQVVSWYKMGLEPRVMSMNLAAKQLKQKDFVKILKKLLKKTSCKAE